MTLYKKKTELKNQRTNIEMEKVKQKQKKTMTKRREHQGGQFNQNTFI